MNNPSLNDTDYDYFRTAEEKKAAEPINHKTDTYKVDGFDIWRPVELYTQTFNLRTDIIYRRRKPSYLQYPRWVKCSERLPEDALYHWTCDAGGYEAQRRYVNGAWWFEQIRNQSYSIIAWVEDSPIPPPPKADPEKDEYKEWVEREYKSLSAYTKNMLESAWHAALASKESKKGDK